MKIDTLRLIRDIELGLFNEEVNNTLDGIYLRLYKVSLTGDIEETSDGHPKYRFSVSDEITSTIKRCRYLKLDTGIMIALCQVNDIDEKDILNCDNFMKELINEYSIRCD